MGAVTAGLVRWQRLPTMGFAAASALSAAVAVSFMACWSLFAFVAVWYLHDHPAVALPPSSMLVVMAILALFCLARWQARAGSTALRLLIWTGCDITCAAFALYLLLPDGLALDFPTLLAAYVLALGAGLLCNTPAGLGGFEVVMLALVGGAETVPLMVAILAFRLVYYVGPFCLALVALARVPRSQPSPVHKAALPGSAPSSWQLSHQSGAIYESTPSDKTRLQLHLAHPAGALVAIGDPGHRSQCRDSLAVLARLARRDSVSPAFYKCSARMAACARMAGWRVARIAEQATLNPQTWDLRGARRQGLRRKLRQAQQAGIRVVQADGTLPWAALDAIAKAWADRHGGEMAFSMGTYSRTYVAEQSVFLIYQGDKLVGFVTFHTGSQDWSLDLIRYAGPLPGGTVPSAIVAALAAARASNIAVFSLASVPSTRGVWGYVCRKRAGLGQFKRSFGPTWKPLYHCAPGVRAFWMSGAAIAWAIHRPHRRILQWADRQALQIRLMINLRIMRLRFRPSLHISPDILQEVSDDTIRQRTLAHAGHARLDPGRRCHGDKPIQHGAEFR
jgi:phosphatidylglycerol lysyltransferase